MVSGGCFLADLYIPEQESNDFCRFKLNNGNESDLVKVSPVLVFYYVIAKGSRPISVICSGAVR